MLKKIGLFKCMRGLHFFLLWRSVPSLATAALYDTFRKLHRHCHALSGNHARKETRKEGSFFNPSKVQQEKINPDKNPWRHTRYFSFHGNPIFFDLYQNLELQEKCSVPNSFFTKFLPIFTASHKAMWHWKLMQDLVKIKCASEEVWVVFWYLCLWIQPDIFWSSIPPPPSPKGRCEEKWTNANPIFSLFISIFVWRPSVGGIWQAKQSFWCLQLFSILEWEYKRETEASTSHWKHSSLTKFLARGVIHNLSFKFNTCKWSTSISFKYAGHLIVEFL